MFGMGTKKNDHKENLDRIKAHFKTNMGEFDVELYAKECPETVWNFVNLAEGRQETKKEGPYYNGLIFHRVISGFVIQGGCPDGNGMGGPGYKFGDECLPELTHDSEGILSMANAGPGTNGSQFFITLAPTPHLDGRHTVFGKVINGIDVVRAIGATKTAQMDRPVEDVVMEEVTIIRD
jgi:cyclophilin family peptidyl-prolyl cis-trans isomerase